MTTKRKRLSRGLGEHHYLLTQQGYYYKMWQLQQNAKD